MIKLYDLVLPIDDNGGVLLHRLGFNPDIYYYESDDINSQQVSYYSYDEIYCLPRTYVKLIITEEQTND